jgi:hypothetical protein
MQFFRKPIGTMSMAKLSSIAMPASVIITSSLEAGPNKAPPDRMAKALQNTISALSERTPNLFKSIVAEGNPEVLAKRIIDVIAKHLPDSFRVKPPSDNPGMA